MMNKNPLSKIPVPLAVLVLFLFQFTFAGGLAAQAEPEPTASPSAATTPGPAIPTAASTPTGLELPTGLEPSAGLEHPATPATPWQVEVDYLLGSLRLPYSSVISGLKVRLPASDALPLALDFRLESQGTFLSLNPQAFDLSGGLTWEALRSPEGSSLGIGLGGTFYGRFASLTEVRSSAVSGFAPFFRLQGRASLIDGPVDLDLGAAADLAAFSDGLSVSLNPVLSLGISWFRGSLEFRGSGLFRTAGEARNTPDSELRMDTFLCLGVRIP